MKKSRTIIFSLVIGLIIGSVATFLKMKKEHLHFKAMITYELNNSAKTGIKYQEFILSKQDSLHIGLESIESDYEYLVWLSDTTHQQLSETKLGEYLFDGRIK